MPAYYLCILNAANTNVLVRKGIKNIKELAQHLLVPGIRVTRLFRPCSRTTPKEQKVAADHTVAEEENTA